MSKIGDYAFAHGGLMSVDIPDSVVIIEDGAFKNCQLLTSVTFSKNVQHIGANVFEDCKNLQSIIIPNSVVSIGDEAFMDIPNVIYTGSAPGSPWGARNLNGYVDGDMIYNDASETVLLSCHPAVQGEVVIPESVKIIGEKAFYRCKHITSVIIPEGVTEIGECAFGICFELSSINIPNTLEVIGKDAFYSCSKLDQATRDRIAQISQA